MLEDIKKIVGTKDFKNAQLEFLFIAAKFINKPKLNRYINMLQHEISSTINFFAHETYLQHVDDLLDELIIFGIDTGEQWDKDPNEIKKNLHASSENYASIRMLAEKYHKEPMLAKTFTALADKIAKDICDDTSDRGIWLEYLVRLDMVKLEQRLVNLHEQKFRKEQRRVTQEYQSALNNLAKPEKGFWGKLWGLFTGSISFSLAVLAAPMALTCMALITFHSMVALLIPIVIAFVLIAQWIPVMWALVKERGNFQQKQQSYQQSLVELQQNCEQNLFTVENIYIAELETTLNIEESDLKEPQSTVNAANNMHNIKHGNNLSGMFHRTQVASQSNESHKLTYADQDMKTLEFS